MKKLILLLSLIAFISFSLKSTHLNGGEMRFEQIGPNQFIISFRIAHSPTDTTLDTLDIGIFDKITHTGFSQEEIYKDSTKLVVSYLPGYAVKFSYYSSVVTLPNNPNGYYAIYTLCCRSLALNTTGNIILSAEIPNPAIAGGNSNPSFNQKADSLYNLCVGRDILLDFSCSDTDGDSLVYSLVPYYDSTSSGGAKPLWFNGMTSGFSSPSYGPGSAYNLDSTTGIFTLRVATLGIYTVVMKCEEYRNGIKIGEVTRDIVVPNLNGCRFVSITEQNSVFSSFSVFPNPSNGNFNINLSDDNFEKATLTIYNMQGKIILSQLLTKKNNLVLIHANSGIYIAKIQVDEHEFTRRIVKE